MGLRGLRGVNAEESHRDFPADGATNVIGVSICDLHNSSSEGLSRFYLGRSKGREEA
jgi:hypothetical protein